jgi:dihydroneopterin aldolase
VDKIRLINMVFYGFHGVSAAEKETGRRFEVDCELSVDLARAGKSDELEDTIDYAAVYDRVADLVQNRSFALLEGLATGIAREILDTFPVIEVTIRVRKLIPPISGQIECIEVEVTRRQANPEKLIKEE